MWDVGDLFVAVEPGRGSYIASQTPPPLRALHEIIILLEEELDPAQILLEGKADRAIFPGWCVVFWLNLN